MSRIFLNNNAINQKGTPLLYTDILTKRPQYGINGRLFFSTDSQQIFEDTGTSWLLLADATGSVSGYVPYTGATANLDLGTFNITAASFISNSFTTGSILFVGASKNLNQDNNNFFWDDNNNRLGIGTNAPGTYIDIHGTNNVLMQLNNVDVSGNLNTTIAFQNQNIAYWRVGNFPNGGQQIFEIYDASNSRAALSIIGSQINTILDFTAAKITGNYIVKSGGTSAQILAADGSVITAGTNITISGGIISSSGSSATTLYTGDGTLTSNRTVSAGGFTLTFNPKTTFNPSVTASSALAQGIILTPTLTAAANSDVLVGLDINPTFSNGAYSSVSNNALRIFTGTAKTSSLTSFNIFSARTNDAINEQAIALNYIGNPIAGNRSFIFQTAENGIAYNGNITLQNQGGKVLIGSNTVFSTSNILEVTGSTRITGNLTQNFNQNNPTIFTISNTLAGTLSQSNITMTSDGASGNGTFGKYSSNTTAYKIITASSVYFYNSTAGNISFLNDVATGNINFATGGVSTAQATLFSTGNLAIGSTTDSGKKLQVNGTTTTTAFSASGASYTVSAIVSEQYYHIFQGSSGQTLTLLSPLNNNLQYVIVNNSGYTLTVAANAAGNIYTTSGTIVSSITLIAYQRVFIISDGNNKYYQIF